MVTSIYHPKGSMCINCKNQLSKDCSDLPFKEMKCIQKYTNKDDLIVFNIVVCTEYKPLK